MPDAATSNASQLSETTWNWLAEVARKAGVSCEFHEFQYHAETDNVSVWQSLSDNGEVLLKQLLEANSHFQVTTPNEVVRALLTKVLKENDNSIVIISHGLGGITAKKVDSHYATSCSNS